MVFFAFGGITGCGLLLVLLFCAFAVGTVADAWVLAFSKVIVFSSLRSSVCRNFCPLGPADFFDQASQGSQGLLYKPPRDSLSQ